MPISNSYPRGVPIEDQDLFVGTKANNNRTVNYTAQGVADYLNINSKVAIGGQMSFQFTIVPNIPKTIAFEGGLGNNTAFSAITKLIVSAIDLSTANITIFLNYLNNSQVLLSQQNQPNFFGHYKITGYAQIGTSAFYELDLEFIGGNGTIGDKQYYDLVSFVLSTEVPPTEWGSITGDIEEQTDLINYISSQITIPTLQDVVETGNRYTGSNGFTEFDSLGNLNLSRNDEEYIVNLGTYSGLEISSSDGDAGFIGIGINQDGNDFVGLTRQPDSGNRAYYSLGDRPNGYYDLATLNDITTPTWQETLDVDFGVSNIVTTPFYYDDGVIRNSFDSVNIRIEQLTGDLLTTTLTPGQLSVSNSTSGKSLYIDYDFGIQFYKVISSSAKSTYIKADNVINNNVIFQLPNKATGTYTLTTLDDIPASVASVTATSPITSSGGTTPDISTSMATNKLIGRSTAGVGVMEEITVGTGLTLSGGTLNASAAGGGIPHATASGTDTYTATITGVTSYADGDAYLIRFTNGNTSGATLNINSLGAITLYRNNDGVLIGGDIISGGEMICVYNSTTSGFQCIGTAPNSLFSYVTNADSVTLTKGMPVYAFGGTGDRMTVKRAYNTGDSTSAQTVGLVLSTSIATNQKGLIMMQGLLDGLSILPTSTWADGDTVYLGSTAGTITNVKPYAPNHLVYLGVVTTSSNGAAGRIYVRVQNGYELDELHNVQAQSPSLKDTLWYDNTVSPAQWKTASISTVLGFTPENVANKENTTLDTSTTKYPTNRLTKEYADAKVVDAITNGVTTIAPSQNAVFDALALKADAYPNYPFNTTTNYFGLFDIVPTISTSVVIGSTANNTNSAVAFNRFSVDKEITISDFAILQNAANDGASATVTLYIFDDSNSGLPGIKLHQETTATGILTPAQKYISFTNNITLQKGNYWIALHFRGLNTAGTNPSFIGGLVNQPNIVTSIATYGINFRPLITGATADLLNNPTITLGAVQNLPQIFIKI